MDYSKYTREQLIEIIDELKMLNEELLSEKEKEVLLDFPWTGNLGHWYFNIKTGHVVFNPLKIEALGYTMEELPDKVHYDFFTNKLHPDDYQNTMDAMTLNMLGKTNVYECEYRIQTKDNGWRWFYDRGKVTKRDKDGKPLFAAGIVFDITERKKQELELENKNEILLKQSLIDTLTEINNRKAIMEKLEIRINQATNHGSPLSIAMFDIDKFKHINDTKGHIFGDKVLKETANIISCTIRQMDSAGRYGGEEFLLIFPNTVKSDAIAVCNRIRKNIEMFDFGDGFKVTISGGVAEYNQTSLSEFIDCADKKLYEAKNSGRNRIIG